MFTSALISVLVIMLVALVCYRPMMKGFRRVINENRLRDEFKITSPRDEFKEENQRLVDKRLTQIRAETKRAYEKLKDLTRGSYDDGIISRQCEYLFVCRDACLRVARLAQLNGYTVPIVPDEDREAIFGV